MSLPTRVKFDYENGILWAERRQLTPEEMYAHTREVRDLRRAKYKKYALCAALFIIGFTLTVIMAITAPK